MSGGGYILGGGGWSWIYFGQWWVMVGLFWLVFGLFWVVVGDGRLFCLVLVVDLFWVVVGFFEWWSVSFGGGGWWTVFFGWCWVMVCIFCVVVTRFIIARLFHSNRKNR